MKTIVLLDGVHDATVPPETQLSEHRELLKLAVDLELEGIVCGQHFLGTEMRYYQPVPYLAHLAAFAPEMRLVLGVLLLPLLNPVQVAEDVATLDVVTGGRVTLGAALGYSDREMRAFGIERSERPARLEESLELITKLWSGAPVAHDGRFYRVDPDTSPSVLPMQRPGPPIWIGGQTQASVRRAARIGDAWYAPPFTTGDALRELATVFADERERLGRGLAVEFPIRRELVVAGSVGDARRGMAERAARRDEVYRKWGLGQGGGLRDAGDVGTPMPEEADGRFILGPADVCAEALADLCDSVGMTHFVYKPQWAGMPHIEAMRQLEAYGEQVLPLVQSA